MMRNRKSLGAYIFSCVFILGVMLNFPSWKNGHTISWDVTGYYTYLPAIIIYKDIKKLDWRSAVQNKYHPSGLDHAGYPHESGNQVMKYPLGMSIAYAPSFLIAHTYAKITGTAADGFSKPYHFCLAFGCLIYAFIGLWFFRKILIRYFSDRVTAIVILLIALGTNYLNYSAFDMPMPHSFLFTLFAILVWSTIRWYENPTYRKSIVIGICIGWAALARPTEILSAMIPILWGIYNWQTIQDRILLWKKHFPKLIVTAIVVGAIGFLQLLYWKYAAGDFIVYSYQDQGFSWKGEHLKDCFFSFRKGWWIYTPLMTFAVLGFLFLGIRREPPDPLKGERSVPEDLPSNLRGDVKDKNRLGDKSEDKLEDEVESKLGTKIKGKLTDKIEGKVESKLAGKIAGTLVSPYRGSGGSRGIFLPTFLFFLINTYIIFSWDIWWYGGGFGQRAMIPSYVLLGFPLAALVEWLWSRRVVAIVFGSAMLFCVWLNLHQTWQAHHPKGGFETEAMTEAYYWKIFGTTNANPEWKILLDTDEEYLGQPKSTQQIYFNDFESETDSILYNNKNTSSGTKAAYLSKDVQFSSKLSASIPSGFQGDWLRATADFYCEQKEWNYWQMSQFVITLEQDDQIVKEKMIRVQRILNEKKWRTFSIDVKIPKDKKFNNVKVKFWNADGYKELWVDNLKIEALKTE